MTLADLFIDVAINADYMDICYICNYPYGEKETIRLTTDMLADLWQFCHDEDVEKVESTIVGFADDYDMSEGECEKLISWLENDIDSLDLKDGQYIISLI